jgi:hypothetical protein
MWHLRHCTDISLSAALSAAEPRSSTSARKTVCELLECTRVGGGETSGMGKPSGLVASLLGQSHDTWSFWLHM